MYGKWELHIAGEYQKLFGDFWKVIHELVMWLGNSVYGWILHRIEVLNKHQSMKLGTRPLP